MRKLKLLPLLLLALILSFSACSNKAPPPPPPSFHGHTISSQGETLAIIASWYTGDSRNWTAIANANPGLKPNKLRIGDVVQIPSELVVKREPLSKKAFQNYLKKSAKADPAPTQATPDTSTAPAAPAQPEPDQSSETQIEKQLEAALPEPTIAAVVDPVPESQTAPVETPIAAPESNDGAPTVAPPSSTEKTRDDLIDEILSK